MEIESIVNLRKATKNKELQWDKACANYYIVTDSENNKVEIMKQNWILFRMYNIKISFKSGVSYWSVHINGPAEELFKEIVKQENEQ